MKAWMIVLWRNKYNPKIGKWEEGEVYHHNAKSWTGNTAQVYLTESAVNRAMASSGYNYMGDNRRVVEIEIPDLE